MQVYLDFSHDRKNVVAVINHAVVVGKKMDEMFPFFWKHDESKKPSFMLGRHDANESFIDESD